MSPRFTGTPGRPAERAPDGSPDRPTDGPSSGPSGPSSALERQARTVLEESLSCIDAHVRSRLNQARQTALDAAVTEPQRSRWRSRMLVPVAGAAMVVVLATGFVLSGLLGPGPGRPSPRAGTQPPLEVLDLLSDGDSVRLMENYDRGFYEWAATQAQTAHGSPPGTKPST